MKVLKATYKWPERFSPEFLAETDMDMPHGHPCFGGLLNKTQDGMWEAKCYEAKSFSAPAKTRLAAIQNCVEEAIRVFADFQKKQKREEEEEQAKIAAAQKRRRENAATILAALRMFQQRYEDKDAEAIRRDWPEHFDGVEPLSTEDIDALCEEINLGTPAPESAAKHTPGPWSVADSGGADNGRYVVGPNDDQPGDRLIADCYGDSALDLGLPSVAEMRANARLIARSPELYAFAALIARMKTEEEFGDDAPPSEDWISTLNDLIAQARVLCAKS